MKILDQLVKCYNCGEEHPLSKYLSTKNNCPGCSAGHIIPVLHATEKAVTNGDFREMKFEDVVESFNLSSQDALNLLILLGCEEEAALDVHRVTINDWPRSEWRRLIGRTRESERKNHSHVESVLKRYGVEIDIPMH